MTEAAGIFTREETRLAGCYVLRTKVREDMRGSFTKVYHEGAFRELGLTTEFREEYFSVSKRNVLRGLHFQLPPADHEKLVWCMSGKVLDVVLDLRRASSTYGAHQSFMLSGGSGEMIYIPRGMAHGFLTLSDEAVMVYKVTSVYAPACDAGIRWDTAGIDWGVSSPLLSERDQGFVSLADFSSPF